MSDSDGGSSDAGGPSHAGSPGPSFRATAAPPRVSTSFGWSSLSLHALRAWRLKGLRTACALTVGAFSLVPRLASRRRDLPKPLFAHRQSLCRAAGKHSRDPGTHKVAASCLAGTIPPHARTQRPSALTAHRSAQSHPATTSLHPCMHVQKIEGDKGVGEPAPLLRALRAARPSSPRSAAPRAHLSRSPSRVAASSTRACTSTSGPLL